MPATATATCTRCDGSGQYHGTRRDGSAYTGSCFACQGGPMFRRRGSTYLRTPTPVAIPEATLPNVVSPVFGLARGNAALLAFRAAHPAEYGWLIAQQSQGVNFAMSLLGAIKRYGNLTPRQLAAVQRNLPAEVIAPDAVGAAMMADSTAQILRANEATTARNMGEPAIGTGIDGQPVTESQVRSGTPVSLSSLIPARAPVVPVVLTVVTIDADPLRRALDAAAASGLRKVRLTLGRVEFNLSGPRFRQGGAGMILCYEGGSYAGYIDRADVFHLAQYRTVTPATLAEFRLAASDPRAAAQAHGNDTGNCACCRRVLSDPPSVMAGIGPICARRFAF